MGESVSGRVSVCGRERERVFGGVSVGEIVWEIVCGRVCVGESVCGRECVRERVCVGESVCGRESAGERVRERVWEIECVGERV